MRPLTCICFLALVVLYPGCGGGAPDSTATQAPEPPQPQTVTVVTGWVDLSGLPELDASVVEVMLVSKLEDFAPKTLAAQNPLVVARLRPPPAESEEVSADAEDEAAQLLSERDRNALSQQLEALRDRLPQPFESTFTVDNRSHAYTSRPALHAWYAEALQQVNLANLVDALNRVGEQMQADYDALKDRAEGEGAAALQARADINWLAVLSDLMSDYSTLVRRYDDLRHRALMMQRREAMRQSRGGSPAHATPADPWLAHHFEAGERLQLALYRDSLDSGYASEDGSFELTGEGTVVAGIEVDGRMVFFIEGHDADAPVRLRDLSRKTRVMR